jgi:hypothetical protein
MAHATAAKSAAEAATHVSRGKCMRGHRRAEHDNGYQEHRLVHADGLLFDALIELNRNRSGAFGCLFGNRIQSDHDLSPRFVSKQFVCSLSIATATS